MNNSINDFMSRDHDRLDEIFKNFVKNRKKKSVQAKELFAQFKQGLETHIGWEEKILFPLFENKTGMEGGPTMVMRTEHEEIKKHLAEILNKINKNSFGTQKSEKQLVEILTGHNDKEEMILYPWIDDSIDEEERKQSLVKMR